MSRQAFISEAKNDFFDVCIIGGGITGAGVLTHAVRRGWKAVLIDGQDFAYGTSSRSSKIIHGGLRYLKLLQFGLVRQALLDREHLLLTHSHLVKPIAFIIPSYRSQLDLTVKSFIIGFYEKLAGKSSLKRFRRLNPEEVLGYVPSIKKEGLRGGLLYWEGWTNDALLTISAMTAAANQTAVVLNYCEGRSFNRKGKEVQSLVCVDKLTGAELTIRAKVFINATGVWLDNILKLVAGESAKKIRPSKGVHLVVSNKKIPSDYAVIVSSSTSDNRLLYCFPLQHGLTALGATDTEYNGSKDKIEVTEEDVDYLLNAFSKGFPSAHLTKRDIVSVYAGLRPMLDDKKNEGSYSRSREFRIWWSADNFVNIAGGKLTSFLSMGKRCIKVVERKMSPVLSPTFRPDRNTPRDGEYPHRDLMKNILKEDMALAEPIVAGLMVTGADVVYHTRYTFALTLADIFTRRTALTYAMKDYDQNAVHRVAAIMAKELNREDNWRQGQIKEFNEHWKEYHPEFLNR